MKILRVKQQDGTLVDIPIGMSAGSSDASEQIAAHNSDASSHSDIRAVIDTKANKSEGAFFIEGSGTTDSSAKTSTWTGTSDRITEYYDGLTIRYKIGVAGQSTTTLNINGLGAKTVYLFNTTKLTTQFPVKSIINLIYHADLNSGCWVCSDYDSNTNTYQRIYPTTTDAEYPITSRYNTTTGSSYYAEYGRYSTGVTLNPSTNTITATKFKGALTGNADTATKATQDASGNVITDTYAKKSDIPTVPVKSVNGKTGAVTINAGDVGADASGTASSAVNTHNADTTAHADIRTQISQLSSEKVDKTSISTGRTQYVKKVNITNGYFWYLSASGYPYEYKYNNFSVLKPITLQAGTYCLSPVSHNYCFLISDDGTVQKLGDFEPKSKVSTAPFVLTLTEDYTLYLAYYTPDQVKETTPYIVLGNHPLATDEYFEGTESASALGTLLNYGVFTEAYIKDCALVANKLDVVGNTMGPTNTFGHYTGVKMDANVVKLMCKARLYPEGDVALVTTKLGSSMVSHITNGSIHLVFGLDNCSVGIFNSSGTLRNLANLSYSVVEGAEVSFGFDVNESTNTLTIYLPDGNTQIVTNDAIATTNGRYAIWEHYTETFSHDFTCSKITKFYCKDASGEVLEDDFKRFDGAIGVAPTGQTYRQFTTHNLNNRDFA